jgi:hypothetical protein
MKILSVLLAISIIVNANEPCEAKFSLKRLVKHICHAPIALLTAYGESNSGYCSDSYSSNYTPYPYSPMGASSGQFGTVTQPYGTKFVY